MAVNISAANSEISNIEESCSAINNYMETVENDFSNGIQTIWNSTAANKVVTDVDNVINAIVDQVNKSLFNNAGESALESVQSAAKNIATYNDGVTIKELTHKTVDTIEASWSGVEDGYNFPELGFDMDGFFQENVISNLNKVVAELENIKGSMKSINSNIGGNYLDNAINSISSNIDYISGSNGIGAVEANMKQVAQKLDEDRKKMELKAG